MIDDERIAICVESGVPLERARAIALCEELMRDGETECRCGAGHVRVIVEAEDGATPSK